MIMPKQTKQERRMELVTEIMDSYKDNKEDKWLAAMLDRLIDLPIEQLELYKQLKEWENAKN